MNLAATNYLKLAQEQIARNQWQEAIVSLQRTITAFFQMNRLNFYSPFGRGAFPSPRLWRFPPKEGLTLELVSRA